MRISRIRHGIATHIENELEDGNRIFSWLTIDLPKVVPLCPQIRDVAVVGRSSKLFLYEPHFILQLG